MLRRNLNTINLLLDVNVEGSDDRPVSEAKNLNKVDAYCFRQWNRSKPFPLDTVLKSQSFYTCMF